MDEDGSEADLARRIIDSDRPSAPAEKRLRLQWNVPLGVPPYIPFWFSMVFLGLVVLVVLDAVFAR